MNEQVLNKLNITVEMVERFCEKEEKNQNSMKFRKEFYNDLLEGRIIVKDGELMRKKVRGK